MSSPKMKEVVQTTILTLVGAVASADKNVLEKLVEIGGLQTISNVLASSKSPEVFIALL